jgi:hypothetical protein
MMLSKLIARKAHKASSGINHRELLAIAVGW